MSDLAAAAQKMNAPEDMVQRSAEARAKATGSTVEAVLAAWAGGESVGGSAPATTTPAAPEPATTEETETAPAASAAPSSAEMAAVAAVGATPAPVVTAPPSPTQVSPQEALSHPVVVTVPTAGLTENTASTLPRWLAAAFLIIPTIGLLYFSGSSGAGACTEGGFQLAVDRMTGVVENCDGSAYEGKGGLGGGAGQFLAIGSEVYATCTACHGAGGAGAGAFPALTGVNVVFSSCTDHIEWVALGSAGFQQAGRATYGDTAKPVGGSGALMPAFASSLTPEQLASVVAYERVAFGGGDAETVLTDCGLLAGESSPTNGAPVDSGAPTETTAHSPEARVGQNG